MDSCLSLCGCASFLMGSDGYRYHKQRDVLNANAYISLDTQFMGESSNLSNEILTRL